MYFAKTRIVPTRCVDVIGFSLGPVYCRSEKYGCPACYECGYEVDENGKETDNIICKDCYSYFNYLKEYNNNYAYDNFNYFDSVLSSKGKCSNCRYDLSESCLKCDFVDNKLTCLLCSPGYYIDSNGKCSSFMDKINKIPNCYQHLLVIILFIYIIILIRML